MRYLSGTDLQMLDSDSPQAMTMLGWIGVFDPATAPDGEVTFDRILDHVRTRLHLSSAFRERLVRVPLGLDQPAWVEDPDFDLEYHVREQALPPPGDWARFTTQVARIGARPLDLSRPPWTMHVIWGLDAVPGVPRDAFAVQLRLHLAAVDGVSGADLVSALLPGTPGGEAPAPSALWRPERVPTAVGLLVRGGVRTLTRPAGSARRVVRAVGGLPASTGQRRLVTPTGGEPALGSAAATRFNRSVTPHRSWDVVRVPAAAAEAIAGEVEDATVGDVAVAVVGGGLRRYLTDKHELPRTSLNALMPVATRSPSTARTAPADLSAGGGGPRFAMMVAPVGTDLADPLERVRLVRRSTATIAHVAISTDELAATADLTPGALPGTLHRAQTRAIKAARSAGAHLVLLHAPGPRGPAYLAGAKAVGLAGLAPLVDGMGLAVTVGSYVDEISLAVTADRDAMPDPGFFAECLRRELAALAAAAGVAIEAEGPSNTGPLRSRRLSAASRDLAARTAPSRRRTRPASPPGNASTAPSPGS